MVTDDSVACEEGDKTAKKKKNKKINDQDYHTKLDKALSNATCIASKGKHKI